MEVNNEVIEVLDYLCGKIGITVDWSSKNVLPYAKQLCEKFINWEIASSTFWIMVGLLLGIIAIVLTKQAVSIYKIDVEKYDCIYREGAFEGCVLGAISSGVIGVAVIAFNIYNIILYNTFPEMALYNFISNSLK